MFLREKQNQMQTVIEGCSSQMLEFEQVNQMSCELIEKLQREVDFYKKELHMMNKNQFSSIIEKKSVGLQNQSLINDRYVSLSNKKQTDYS